MCLKGTAENQRTLNPTNRKVYQHYLECRATGIFPDDPWVRKHAAIIKAVEEALEKRDSDIRDQKLQQVLMVRKALSG